MSDRSVSVALVANVAGFVSGMKVSQASVAKLNQELMTSAKKQQALRELGNAAGALGAVAAAGFFTAVKAAATFDQAMSHVAATGSDAKTNIDALRQAALDFGQSTQFSATEAAGGIEALLKAGVSAQDVLGGGLAGALNLAAASNMDVAQSAEAAANAMSQFGLSGAEVPHIADLLAAAAGKAQGEVSDMAMALNQVGLVANQTGLSIEETTGGLAAFAHAGLIGSDAGTSFKTMLQSLTPRSAEAASLIDKLHISAFDLQGNFIGLTQYAGKLRFALKDMSQEQQAATLKTIFGSDAVRAASVLYKEGAGGVQGWIDATDDAGFAAETAATKMDNLMGDLEQLKGAFETALIGTGSSANGPLREMVQILTDLINAYNSLPGPVKSGALALTGLTAVIGLTAFAASRAVLAYGNFKTNLSTIGITAEAASKKMFAARAGALALGTGLAVLNSHIDDSHESIKAFLGIASSAAIGFSVGGPWGAAIGAGAGLLQAFSASSQRAQAATDALTGTLNSQTGAITENSREWAANQVIAAGLVDDLNTLGISAGTFTDAMLGNKDALAAVNSVLTDYEAKAEAAAGSTGSLGRSQDRTVGSIVALRDLLGLSNGTLDEARSNLDFTKDAAKGAADGLGGLGDTAAEAGSQITTLKDAFEDLNAALSNRASARDYEAAIDDATKALKENGRTLNDNTEKGRENAATLDNIASTAIKHAQAMKEDGASVQAQRKFLQGARDDLFDQARAFGMSKDAAHAYVNEVLGIPKRVSTQIDANTAQAQQAINSIKSALLDMNGNVYTTHLEVIANRPTIGTGATGGTVFGGTPGKDSVLKLLMPGEEVIRTSAARKHRPLLKMINADGMADGGTVGDSGISLIGSKDTRDLTKALKSLERETERAKDEYHDALDEYKQLRSEARQYAASVASAFQHDAFGGSLADSELQLRADRNDAREARKDLRRARHHGLDGPLARMLALSGNTALISEVGDLGHRGIAQYERLLRQSNRATGAIGRDASQAAYGKQIRQQNEELKHLRRTLEHLNRELHQMGERVERGAAKGTHDGTAQRQRVAATQRRAG